MTTEQALLRAIGANPEDITPRLSYADWLEENEQSERAEFIRVQCELADIEALLAVPCPDQDLCTGVSANWCPVCGDCCCPAPENRRDHIGCPLHAPRSRHGDDESLRAVTDALRCRERELLEADWVRWYTPVPVDTVICENLNNGRSPGHFTVTFRRGFVEQVACTATDFMRHAEAIFRSQPINEVRLSDKRPSPMGPEEIERALWVQAWVVAEGVREQDYCLLFSLFRRLEGGVVRSATSRGYAAEAGALAALSTACLAWAREQAGIRTPGHAAQILHQ